MNALSLFAAMLAAHEGYHAISGYGPDGHGHTRRLTAWHRADDWEGLARRLRILDEPELAVVPRQAEGDVTWPVLKVSVVWARAETGKQLEALERFRPRPTLLLRLGDSVQHTALWATRSELKTGDAVRVSRHLAHALGTPKKHSSEDLLLQPPGALLTAGRNRPAVVKAVHANAEAIYPIGVICRRLPRDIPDPLNWLKATDSARAAA